MDAFSLNIDHVQSRITRDRLLTQITGTSVIDDKTGRQIQGWAESTGNVDAAGDPLCWVEPITGKLMLRPAPLSRLWQTTATGIFARIKKANLTLTTSSAWEDNEFTNQAGVSVAIKDKAFSEEARTTATYSANQPFYVAPVFFASGTDNRGYLDCGWGSSAAGVSVRFYANGRAEIRKAGVLIDTKSWSGNGFSPQQATGQRVGFVLIPVPPNELIVVSTLGGGFVHVFHDLDPITEGNEVAPASYFRFQCVDMGTDVEIAKVQFPSSGYVDSVNTFFQSPPEAGASETMSVYFASPGYGTSDYAASLRSSTGGAVFTPDGTAKECRIRMTLTGDGTATRYILGARAVYESVIGETPDEELDLTEYTTGLRLSAGMDPASVQVSATLRSPFAINDLGDGSRRLISTENRPVALKLGTLLVVDGVGERPSYDGAVEDEAFRVHLKASSIWRLLEEYRFTEHFGLDGQSLGDGFREIMAAAGVPATSYEVSPEADDIDIEWSLAISRGVWSTEVSPRDTAAEVLKRIQEQYVPDWFLNIKLTIDGPKLAFLSPAIMGEAPVLTLYDNVAAAQIDGVDPPWSQVFHNYNQTSPGAEFTYLAAYGEDQDGRPIVAVRQSEEAQDPTVPVASRIDEWTGTPRKAGFRCSFLRSQDAVSRSVDAMWRRAFYRRTMAEWECELLINPETGLPVWVGDVVELVGVYGDYGDYRIQSIDVALDTEPVSAEDTARRRCRYMGEKIQPTRDDSVGLGHARQSEKSLMELALGWKKLREAPAQFEKRPVVSVE